MEETIEQRCQTSKKPGNVPDAEDLSPSLDLQQSVVQQCEHWDR